MLENGIKEKETDKLIKKKIDNSSYGLSSCYCTLIGIPSIILEIILFYFILIGFGYLTSYLLPGIDCTKTEYEY